MSTYSSTRVSVTRRIAHDGVVLAVANVAHRDGDADFLEHSSIFVTGILIASIAVMQELGRVRPPG